MRWAKQSRMLTVSVHQVPQTRPLVETQRMKAPNPPVAPTYHFNHLFAVAS